MVLVVAADSLVRFPSQGQRPFHGQKGKQGTWWLLLDRLSTYRRAARQEVYWDTRAGHHCAPRGDRRQDGEADAIMHIDELLRPHRRCRLCTFKNYNGLSKQLLQRTDRFHTRHYFLKLHYRAHRRFI